MYSWSIRTDMISRSFAESMKTDTPVTRTPANRAEYASFGTCFKLPVWKDTMCHTTESERFDRQVTWKRIQLEFELTRLEQAFVKMIHKMSKQGGWLCAYNSVTVANGHKARTINKLVKKEAIKVIDGNIILNPAILIGRAGWSQFLLGAMLVQWMNERSVQPRCPLEWEKKSIKLGALWAKESEQHMEVIPHSIKGRVEGHL